MCLAAFAWNVHPRFPLVLVSNRDEFHARPAAAWHAWEDAPLHGGRDLQAGGAWLALNAQGGLALLTNLREPGQTPGRRSRGDWAPRWLQHGTLPSSAEAMECGGFNLLTLDLSASHTPSPSPPALSALWHTNRPEGLQSTPIAPGFHGLSNAALNTPWPKTQRLVQGLVQAVPALLPSPAWRSPPTREDDDPQIHLTEQTLDQLAVLLHDTTQPPDEALPRTGVDWSWERLLGRIFIQSAEGQYGTRASTVVVAERTGLRLRWHVLEQRWGPHGAEMGRTLTHVDAFIEPRGHL